MGLMEKFQKDLQNGMTLEAALQKYNLTFKEAVDFTHKPLTRKPKRKKNTYTKKNYYEHVEDYISRRADSYHLRKTVNGKMVWGGSYSSLEDARQVRDFLEKEGWNIIKVNEACKKHNIKRRRR